ncbi:MAG TPA: enolase C-terminal domain-like protein [Polyangiaceae bacterium]|jgi:L-alanine-DL-glutamate epimerase-like enolase superfamily enzyme|nr:enolase C-terminal domain-like protein [Polyangiaceae bacterium]
MATVDRVTVSAFSVPTDLPEADGTFEWQRTVLVTVELASAMERGFGYTYADEATAKLIESSLAEVVLGADPFAIPGLRSALRRKVRNVGSRGIAAMGISALDVALWDLKSRLLSVPLLALLGARRESVEAYGSGGFTSYSDEALAQQLGGWVSQGLERVKMKVGAEPARDRERVHVARDAIGPSAALFVDANGAYSRKQALELAESFAERGVSWFEEPVSSDDLPGLRLLRDRAPARMDIAAGEYGYESGYFLRMLEAGAVDVLQADATRCGGVSGFLEAAALADAAGVPLSAHCAPSLHGVLGCACERVRHVEYFHDHARLEAELFDGALVPRAGLLRPDDQRPGLGFVLRPAAAERYCIATVSKGR